MATMTTPQPSHPKPAVGDKTFAQLLEVPPPQTTREKLIAVATELFMTYGFHAVGLDRILRDVGISKQAFYRHFDGKDALAIEAVKQRDELEGKAFIGAVQARVGPFPTPRKAILAMFEVMDEIFNAAEFEGCLFLTACFEFPDPRDPLHRIAMGHYTDGEAYIAAALRSAGCDDAEGLAAQIMLVLQGAFTRRVVNNDDAAARRAHELISGLLDARLPSGNDADEPAQNSSARPPVDLVEPVDHRLRREPLGRERAASLAHAAPQLGVADELG